MLGVATATSKPRRRLASETEGTEEPASKRRRTESSNEGDTPAASFGETLLEADADAKEATRSRKRSRHPKTVGRVFPFQGRGRILHTHTRRRFDFFVYLTFSQVNKKYQVIKY